MVEQSSSSGRAVVEQQSGPAVEWFSSGSAVVQQWCSSGVVQQWSYAAVEWSSSGVYSSGYENNLHTEARCFGSLLCCYMPQNLWVDCRLLSAPVMRIASSACQRNFEGHTQYKVSAD